MSQGNRRSMIGKLTVLFMGLMLTSAFLCGAAGKDQVAELQLEAVPGAGCEWRIKQKPESGTKKLFKIEKKFLSQEQELAGGRDVVNYTMRPIKAGKVQVEFIYAPYWKDNEDAYKIVYEFRISKERQIEFLSKKIVKLDASVQNDEIQSPDPMISSAQPSKKRAISTS